MMEQSLYDKRALIRLLKKFTGLKVYEAKPHPCYGNFYVSISEEYIDSNSPHITVCQGSWELGGIGSYKVCIYLPNLSAGLVRRKPNMSYHRWIIGKIKEALESEFPEEWNSHGNELDTWTPMSRHSVYLQIPNFDQSKGKLNKDKQ